MTHQSTFLTLKDVQSRNCVNILTKGINVAAIANCNLVTENNRNRSGGWKFKAKVGPSIPFALLAFTFFVMEINYSALFLSLPKATSLV